MASALHNHSEFSLLDGFSHPKEYLDRAKELGLKAFAITEHGNQYSWCYFDKLKKDYPEIKMIYGVEFYECFDINIEDQNSKYFHLIGLAKNEHGRVALNEIITKSNFDGFYYKPRVDLNMLKPYAEDLIIISACLASKIAREEDYNKCIRYIEEYKSIFPHFYLEMQSHKTIDQEKYNQKILQLAFDTKTQFVITTDSHAATKEDLYYQARHVQIARDDDTLTELYDDCYLQSDKEIHEIMDHQIGKDNVDIGIKNSDLISDMIDEVNMPFQHPTLPTFPLPEGYDDNYSYLKHLCDIGWHIRKIDNLSQNDQKTRSDRLNYELNIIHEMGYDGYFLFVWDFIKWAKENDVYVGDGRGCFTPDTNILLENGQVKKIQEVNVGDKVITHLGNIKQVLNTYEYNCNEELFTIKSSDTKSITCTNNHEIFAVKTQKCYQSECCGNKGRLYCTPTCKKYGNCKEQKPFKQSWVKAEDLKEGDYVCYPKVKHNNFTKDYYFDLVEYTKGVENIKYDKNYIWTEKGANKYTSKKYCRFIRLDEDFCLIAGWFISQGWTRIREKINYEIGFAHHSDKLNLIKSNTELMYKLFGLKMSNSKYGEKQVVQLIASSKIHTIFFDSLFGHHAENKHIPDVMMKMEYKLKQKLLKGLWDGDGNYKISTGTNKTKYSTINYNLAKQVQMLLQDFNIPSSINIRKHNDNKNWHDEYSTTVSGIRHLHMLDKICENGFENLPQFKKTVRLNWSDDNYSYHRIKKIDRQYYDGKVYDLSVEDDTSYITESIAVHNSGGGSIVDYLLGISELDPITYNLIFERFLNPERVSMPDIDTDFSDREKVVRYITNKYGEDKVCQVINFSYITPIVAINDVGRVLGIPYNVCKKISKKFIYETFDECVRNNSNIYTDFPEYGELFDIASKLSGRVRQASIHAGGVGIVDTKITDYMAMKVGSKGERVIQVDKKVIEDIGIIKFDLLGLATTLNTIKDTLKYANISNSEIDINNPNFLNNKEMYELLCSAETNGVFQVESQGMKDLLQRLQPSNLEDVSAVLALYRPDSMGALDEYIECKHGRQEVKYIHDDMKPILESTYGCMIYQEQLMDIVRKFGGRTYGGADLFRKAIGKKDINLVQTESKKLYQEIMDNGYTEDIARQISEELSKKGGYLFNKSHSALYSILTLKTAYLKKKYPVEFFCALLNQKRDDYGALNKYIIDAKNFGVELLPPHLNKSERCFKVNNSKILFGLEAIKGIGEKFVNALLEERTNGKFENFNNFYERMKPSNAIVISLTKAGAIPCKDKKSFLVQFAKNQFESKPYTPIVSLPKLSVLKEKYNIDTDIIKDKTTRLKLYNIEREKEYNVSQKEKYEKSIKEFTEKYLQNEKFWEFDALSVFIKENPFVEAYKFISTPFDDIEEGSKGIVIGVIANIQKKKDRNGKQFAFLWMYSAFGLIEVICWHTQYKQYEDLIKRGNQIAMLCQKNDDKAIVKEMKTYDQWLEDRKLSKLK